MPDPSLALDGKPEVASPIHARISPRTKAPGTQDRTYSVEVRTALTTLTPTFRSYSTARLSLCLVFSKARSGKVSAFVVKQIFTLVLCRFSRPLTSRLMVPSLAIIPAFLIPVCPSFITSVCFRPRCCHKASILWCFRRVTWTPRGSALTTSFIRTLLPDNNFLF